MSTILKALQKVEGKRQTGESPFPEDLALFEKPRSRRSGTRSLLLLLVSGALIGAGGWQVYNRLMVGSVNPAPTRPVEGEAAPVLLLSPEVPTVVSRESAGQSPKSVVVATPTAEGPATPRVHKRSAEDIASVPRVAGPEPAVKTAAVISPGVGRPRLVVSGIAYQEDRAGRLAVVNDRPVGEGEEIGGAVVTAILEDRVRFTRAGETFEVGLATRGNPRK